jgi:hypothetical protein
MSLGVQGHAPAALPLQGTPGTHCIGGWVGPTTGLDGCGKSRPPPGFDPRTVQPVASRYTDYDYLGHGQVAGCCEDGNELSVSTECDDSLVWEGD